MSLHKIDNKHTRYASPEKSAKISKRQLPEQQLEEAAEALAGSYLGSVSDRHLSFDASNRRTWFSLSCSHSARTPAEGDLVTSPATMVAMLSPTSTAHVVIRARATQRCRQLHLSIISGSTSSPAQSSAEIPRTPRSSPTPYRDYVSLSQARSELVNFADVFVIIDAVKGTIVSSRRSQSLPSRPPSVPHVFSERILTMIKVMIFCIACLSFMRLSIAFVTDIRSAHNACIFIEFQWFPG